VIFLPRQKWYKFSIHKIAHDGLIVARGTNLPSIGAPVFIEVEKKYLKIGKVADAFGPVEKPYITVRLNSEIKKSDIEFKKIKDIYVAATKTE